MNKKGFTLIEVLAVLVILGVIMVVAIPEISHFITRSKMDALKVSADGIVRAAELYRAGNETSDEVVKFTILNGEEIGENKLNYQGKIDSGTIMIYGENETALCVTSGRYTALKNLDDITISVTEGSCVFNEVTQEFEAKEYCGDFKDQIDSMTTAHNEEIFNLTKEYDDKLALAKSDYELQVKTLNDTYSDQISALNQEIADLNVAHQAEIDQLTQDHNLQLATQKAAYEDQIANLNQTHLTELNQLKADYDSQILTQKTAYESQIAALNSQITNLKSQGTATAANILTTKSALVNGTLINGTMANNGALSSALNAGGTFNIPAGYTTGGTITANSLAGQTSSTATVTQILFGQTAYVNGTKLTGTMANNGALSSALNAGQSFNIPTGYTTGGTITANSLASQTNDATATSSDIAPGKTAYVNGNKVTGTMVVDVSANLITKTRDFSFSSSTSGQENWYVTSSTLTFDFPTKIVGVVSMETIARNNAWVNAIGGVVTGANTVLAGASYPRTYASSGTFRVTAIGY